MRFYIKEVYMRVSIKNSPRILLMTGVFLLIVVATGCQDRHLFRFGTTEPSPVGNSFLVIGDSRSGDSIYKDIVASMTSSSSFASCFIHLGDMIDSAGDHNQWNNFLTMTAPIARIMPWYAVVGNHDVDSIRSQQIYQDVMGSPSDQLYYSFNKSDSHFIILNTEVPGQVEEIAGEQLAWLKRELQTYADSAHYLFVFTHRPPFPQGRYRGKNLANADELHQLFIQYGVDIVFSAHEHQYSFYQKDEMHYIVSGGGGAPIYRGGNAESYHHYLLVELLPPDTIFIHIMDVHGKVIRTDVVNIQ
jgi:predicted phosphodiesterase